MEKITLGRLKLFVWFLALTVFVSCTDATRKKEQRVADVYVKSELAVQHGMQLFNQHCASCHNFNTNVIGPNLGGVTSEVSKDWLIRFIKNPQASIDSADARALKLHEKYKIVMPSFEYLTDTDIEDVLGFIHKYTEAEKKSSNKRPGAITNPVEAKIPESNLVLVLEEFLQVPPSSDAHPSARINKLKAIKGAKGSRLFIADLRGKLYEVVDTTVQVFLDVGKELENFIDKPGFGSGLGSFDFHPEFKSNGLLYTTHTESSRIASADFALPDSLDPTLQWVLTEWKFDNPKSAHFFGKKRELLRVAMKGSAHGFQELTFNPAAKKGDDDYGLLYLGVGDGGAIYADQAQLTGSKAKIWGTVIRIDPLGSNSSNGRYGIPQDNPFIKDSSAVAEIWAYGFRNPHRITWDLAATENIFVSNIGRYSLEEVNLLERGANYGWPNREGTFLFDSKANTEVVYPLPNNDEGYTYPIIQFDHDEGAAISGGFVYRANEIALLQGKYLFGDIPKGTLFFADVSTVVQGEQESVFKINVELNGEVTTLSDLLNGERVDLRFGSDLDGALYILTKYDGRVYKVVDCKEKS